jgi:hypothetical protein
MLKRSGNRNFSIAGYFALHFSIVEFAAMANRDDPDLANAIFYLITNPPIANANAP